jgi:ABC-type transport system substrate-binding protein
VHKRFCPLFAAVAPSSCCRCSSWSCTGQACRSEAAATDDATAGLRRGGSLVASVRGEPRSFSRLLARDTTTQLVSDLTQARLVRVNRVTDEVEPWLAERWTVPRTAAATP